MTQPPETASTTESVNRDEDIKKDELAAEKTNMRLFIKNVTITVIDSRGNEYPEIK